MLEKLPSDLLQTLWGFVATWAMAGIGRLLWHVQMVSTGKRSFWSWWLIWELLTALGCGVMAEGVADWAGLTGKAALAVIVFGSYLGPRGIEVLLLRIVGRYLPPENRT